MKTSGIFRIVMIVLTLGAIAWGGMSLMAANSADKSADIEKVEVEPSWHPLRTDFGLNPTTPQNSEFPGERSRRILAMYDSNETVEEEDDDENITHRPVDSEVAMVHLLAELPLNHLGLVVDYHDVNGGILPSSAEMAKYLGVISWFSDDMMAKPNEYLSWLALQAQEGRRVVVMERIGALRFLDESPSDTTLVEAAFEAIGGKYLGNWSDDASSIALVTKDETVMGLEQALPSRFEFYQHYQSVPGSKVYLQLERTDIPESVSDVVWTGPTGGFVMPTMAYSETRLGERYVQRWILNPFRFFEDAFGVKDWPRPDFTTLGGRRIFYFHIDGDGLGTITELDYKTRCGEVIRRDILAKYDLPVTASVVVGRTSPEPFGKGSEQDMKVARAIFAMDNVEIGSHGYAHPMDWRAGEKAELSVPDLPDYSLSGKSEVAGTVDFINKNLSPPGKECRVMLWTGWCNPSEEHLVTTYKTGVRNLNGGDPRMDSHYPSYAHMVPPVHQVGKHLQYLTSASNEYILTDDWTPPYYRFQNVIQTFENTGSPKRVVPVNIYIHYYIARNFPGLQGLITTLKWILDHPLAPVFVSEYVDIARDFHWARIAERGPGHWVIRKGPALLTIRFDRPDLHIDLEASKGVIGYLNDKDLGVTYVHLTEANEASVIIADTPPNRAYLHTATHLVRKFSHSETGFAFETGGVGLRRFEVAGLTEGKTYKISASVEGIEFNESSAKVVDGVVSFTIEKQSTKPISIQGVVK